VRAKEVMDVLQICRRTLARYVKSGQVKIDATINGQHRYNAESVFALLGKEVPDNYKNNDKR
jgi:predicted site-specific integrase-resolvase